MRLALSFAFFLFTLTALPEESPFATESRVKTDIDSMLARIVAPENFLVQVNATINTRAKRQLIEGETVEDQPSRKKESTAPPEPLPGFVPQSFEPSPAETVPAKKTRETYRTVEVSTLQSIQVNVSFDESIPPEVLTPAKKMVSDYLYARFPKNARLNFYQVPMLKKKVKEPPPPPPPAPAPEEPTPSLEDKLLQWGPWAAVIVLLLLLLARNKKANTKSEEKPQPQSYPPPNQFYPPYPIAQPQVMAPKESDKPENKTEEDPLGRMRSTFLNQIIQHSSSFRLYYENLTPEKQSELEACVQGAAFDTFMNGLGVDRSPPSQSANELEKLIVGHQTQFTEYIRANQWKENQLFGFLYQLSNEQLMSVVNFESDTNVCLLLRFLTPSQSAFVLDNLSADRRLSILGQMTAVHSLPLAEVSRIEKEVRTIVQRIPPAVAGLGKQDVDFWGDVLSETTHTSDILEELEQTHSEIIPHLQKYRFSLEDAASLPDEYLSRVIAETDNEELCLALVTCPEDVATVILDSVSEKRRNVLRDQLPSYRTANRERTQKARVKLTKRIREAMAQ